MIAKLISNRRCAFLSLFAASLLLAPARSQAADTDDADRDGCRKNLTALYNAIQAYRVDHKDLPNWLSDLVPKYIKDPNVLMCPIARRTGAINTYGIDDPKIATGYSYQFADAPIPKTISGAADHTMKEWKRRQMGLVGGRVPMVRCHLHTPLLNVSFDGALYDSPGAWENNVPEVESAELFPARLFATEAMLAAKSSVKLAIPQRNTRAQPNLIDLSRFYNAALSESWHPNNGAALANDLELLPRGLQKFAGIEFDTRGIIQLSSKKLNQPRFPLSVKNIKVDQKASRLHFLHSTGWSASEGTPVATYVIHLASGKTHEFTIQYGIHVVDWVKDEEPPESTIAWSGKSPANDSQQTLHLFKTQWNNPDPNEIVASIDFVSANRDPAPFLIAITAETP